MDISFSPVRMQAKVRGSGIWIEEEKKEFQNTSAVRSDKLRESSDRNPTLQRIGREQAYPL